MRAETFPMVVMSAVLVNSLDNKKRLSNMIIEISELKSGLQIKYQIKYLDRMGFGSCPRTLAVRRESDPGFHQASDFVKAVGIRLSGRMDFVDLTAGFTCRQIHNKPSPL